MIEVTITNGIAEVRLNRPEQHNALNGEMMDGLITAARQIHADPTVRVAVLSGEGRSFCSGLDMANFGSMASGSLTADSDNVQEAYRDLSPGGANRPQQVGWLWQEIAVPTIAAVHGHALGGGLNLALATDLRVMAPDARLGFVEITWGLMPDMSASQSLRRLVGSERAKLLMLTGRRFTGQEAYDWGLTSELAANPLDRAMEIAGEIAVRNPESTRAILGVLNQAVDADTASGLANEAKASSKLIGTANQIEAVSAMFENREPSFRDPSCSDAGEAGF